MFVTILGDKVLDELLAFVRRGVFTAKSGLYGLRKTEDAVLSRREIGESTSKERLNLSNSAEHNETQIAVKLIGAHNLGEARILTEYSPPLSVNGFVRKPVCGKPVIADVAQGKAQLINIADFKPFDFCQDHNLRLDQRAKTTALRRPSGQGNRLLAASTRSPVA